MFQLESNSVKFDISAGLIRFSSIVQLESNLIQFDARDLMTIGVKIVFGERLAAYLFMVKQLMKLTILLVIVI